MFLVYSFRSPLVLFQYSFTASFCSNPFFCCTFCSLFCVHQLVKPKPIPFIADLDDYNPQRSIIHSDNLRVLPRGTLVPYFDAGTTVEDLIVTDPDTGDFVSVRPPVELLRMFPVYDTNTPSSPPPCPCDTNGRPLALVTMTTNGLLQATTSTDNIDFLLRATRRACSRTT